MLQRIAPALYLPPFSWSRQRGTIAAIAVFAAAMIALQLITGQGIAYFDISSIGASAATLALAALGETIVILAGGLDLSAGAVISLVNVVLVTQLSGADMGTGLFTLVALVIALGLGGAIGAVNGFLVAYVRLQSIVVTLATMFIAQGAALLVLKFPGGEMPWDFSLVFTGDVVPEGLPAPVVVLAVAILFWLVLKNTRIGTGIYAIGSDQGSAEANGVDVRRTRFLTFTFAGMCYGAAGLFITANMGGGDPLIGAKMLLQIFAAVVLGGTLIGGGRGGAVGTIFGALTLTVIVNIFLVLGVRTYYTPIVEGVILLIAVLGFSLGRDSPVVDIARFWRATLRALRESTLPSRLRVLGEPIRLGGLEASAGGAAPAAAASWLDRHRAVLRFAVPAYLIYIVILGTTVGIFGGDFSPLAYLNAMLILTAFLAILGLGQGHGHHHRRARSLGALDHHLPGHCRHHALQRHRRAGDLGDPGGARDRDRHRLPQRHDHRPFRALADHRDARHERHPGGRVAALQLGRAHRQGAAGAGLVRHRAHRRHCADRLVPRRLRRCRNPLPEQECAGPAHLRCRQQPARQPPLGRADRLPYRRRLCAERLLLGAGRNLHCRLQWPGLLRHGRSVPALIHRRGGAGRNPDHRRPRPLCRDSGRRDPLHRARHHAVGHGAARGRAQHHLRPRPARRDSRAP